MSVEPVEIGNCQGCGKNVYGGEVTVDQDGQKWHPACRDAALKKRTAKRSEVRA